MKKIKFHYKEFINKKGLTKYWFILRNFHIVIAKYSNVLLMILVFFVNPSKLYKYSWRGWFPTPKMRNKNKDSLEKIYEPSISKNFEIDMSKKKIFFRGYEKNIIYDKNVILVNFKVNHRNKNAIFSTTDYGMVNYYLENNVDVIYNKLVVENDEGLIQDLSADIKTSKKLKTIKLKLKTNLHKNIPLGSGIIAILAFYLISRKLKVYGWNYYQKKSLAEMNIFEFIFKIFFYFKDIKTRNKVEYSLTHLLFAYYFKDFKNLKINGYLDYYKNNFFNRIMTKRLKAIYLK